MTLISAASIRERLFNLAKSQRVDFNNLLTRYALERILYRLSQSEHAEKFLLKGALLFGLWYGLPHRATRDADLLGFGEMDLQGIQKVFQNIASVKCDDGIFFDFSTVIVSEIRKRVGGFGVRVILQGELAGAKCKTQIDIGFGDAVTPGSEQVTYPTLIEGVPAPQLRAYPTYTVVAEKFHAIWLLGMGNSRLKDYFDLYVLFDRERFDPNMLRRAISATFERRGVVVPLTAPIGLSDEFAMEVSKNGMWNSFLRKNGLDPVALVNVVHKIRGGLGFAI